MLSFELENASGDQIALLNWSNCAPTATLEASVVSRRGAFKVMRLRSAALARIDLLLVKVSSVRGDQGTGRLSFFVEDFK